MKMLPETPILDAKEAKKKFETAMLIINPIETFSLRRMVLGGNRYALEAVFRLLNISDGALTEMLFILLGDVLKQQPRLYLETLEIYKDMDVFRLIGKYGVAMSIEPLGSKEEKAELQSRLDALETVKDEKFCPLRDACI